MRILSLLLHTINPILVIMGIIAILLGEMTLRGLLWGFGLAFIGFILGFILWEYNIAPKEFWIKSSIDLLGSRIGIAIEQAICFFMIPTIFQLIFNII